MFLVNHGSINLRLIAKAFQLTINVPLPSRSFPGSPSEVMVCHGVCS